MNVENVEAFKWVTEDDLIGYCIGLHELRLTMNNNSLPRRKARKRDLCSRNIVIQSEEHHLLTVTELPLHEGYADMEAVEQAQE